MIQDATGNILDAKVDALVNPVNCVGVMGAGLALSFKRKYPAMFIDYEASCLDGLVHVGHMHVYFLGCVAPPQYIINFPTKDHFRNDSTEANIELGLRDLVRVIEEQSIQTIAVPRLGCGLGGLDWKDVRPLIEHHLSPIENLRVLLY